MRLGRDAKERYVFPVSCCTRVRPTRFRENITPALSPCKTDLEKKTRLFFSLPTALLKTTLTQIIVSKLKLTRHLYGEKLSRERGSPSQPSQLKRAVTGEKKLTHLSHPKADNIARTLTELTRLGELVFLCGEKLAQLRE